MLFFHRQLVKRHPSASEPYRNITHYRPRVSPVRLPTCSATPPLGDSNSNPATKVIAIVVLRGPLLVLGRESFVPSLSRRLFFPPASSVFPIVMLPRDSSNLLPTFLTFSHPYRHCRRRRRPFRTAQLMPFSTLWLVLRAQAPTSGPIAWDTRRKKHHRVELISSRLPVHQPAA